MDIENDVRSKNNGNYASENIDSKGEGVVGLGLGVSSANKGRGLKKWRRIRRESGKETNGVSDVNRKRGIPVLPGGLKQRSGDSSSSTNAVSNVIGSSAFDRLPRGGDIVSRADSENSRSSTAASVPRPSLGGLVQSDREKGRDFTKKARGGRIKKENSISSLESDSRSSNFVFAQGANFVTSNGRWSGRAGNYEDDDSDDADNGERRVSGEGRGVFSKNEADSGDVSREEKGDNDHVGLGDQVDLVECIMPLHLAQEALEREVQKLRDVGIEDTLSSDGWVQPSGSSFVDEEFQSSKNMQTQNEIHIQNKLEEALVMLELQDTKISELESILKCNKIKNEHEEFLTQRIAAELEYLVISETIQNMKADHIDQMDLSLQQKSIALASTEQVQLEDAKKLKNRVCRYAYCFTVQLVLLLVVLHMLFMKFSSKTKEVIPT